MKEKEILEKVDNLLSVGVGEFVDPEGKFKEKLIKKALGESSEEIVIKFGVDPTRPDIHLGHAVVFQKLRQFQELGCKVVFLVGDFTARIGDPTGKSKVRPELEQEEVERNVRSFLEPLEKGKLLLTSKEVFSWIGNSDWFYTAMDIVAPQSQKVEIKIDEGSLQDIAANSFIGKSVFYLRTRMQRTHLGNERVHEITLRGLLFALKHITHQELISRDMFKKRLEKEETLYMHEMLYPVLQGIDSLMIHLIYGKCDLEVGGTDQHFNMLMGRKIQLNDKETLIQAGITNTDLQAVLSFKLLEGMDGKEKMSKSLDNYIGVNDEPVDMYGKLMSIPDTSLLNYFELCTFKTIEELKKIEEELEAGKNPRDLKMRLAREVVTMYHNDNLAALAETVFIETFQKGGVPEEVIEITGDYTAALIEQGIVASKSELRRLLEAGGVRDAESGEKFEEIPEHVQKETVLKIGKRRFVKLLP